MEVGSADVMEIGSEEDLIAFGEKVNAGSRDIDAKLTRDITLTKNWRPVGTYVFNGRYVNHDDHSYQGTFDGNGKTIRGLKVVTADAAEFVENHNQLKAIGLFGVLGKTGVVKNLNIEAPKINGEAGVRAGSITGALDGQVESCTVTGGMVDGSVAGGIAGWTSAGSGISACRVSNITVLSTEQGYDEAGGIAGYSHGLIDGCAVSGKTAIAGGHAGGIAGETMTERGFGSDAVESCNSCVTNCTVENILNVIGEYAGGIAGRTSGTHIADCRVKNIGLIEGDFAGGLAGIFGGDNLTNSTAADSPVLGRHYAGGLTGSFGGTDSVLGNCAALAMKVSANRWENNQEINAQAEAGSLVGRAEAAIRNCTAVGFESGSVSAFVSGSANLAYAGGLVGFAEYPDYYRATQSKFDMKQCLCPIGIVKCDGIVLSGDKVLVGNIDPASADEICSSDTVRPEEKTLFTENAFYDAELPEPQVGTVAAMIEQGVLITIEQGETRQLNVRMLPGTKGLDCETFTWTADNAGVEIVPKDSAVLLMGAQTGVTNVTCKIEGDALSADLVCQVRVVEKAAEADVSGDETDRTGRDLGLDDPGNNAAPGDGGSSGCNAFGAGLALLAALPFVRRKSK